MYLIESLCDSNKKYKARPITHLQKLKEDSLKEENPNLILRKTRPVYTGHPEKAFL